MAYQPNGLDFDGAADYLSKGADLTGAADSKTGILSIYFRIDAVLAATRMFFRGGNCYFFINAAEKNQLYIEDTAAGVCINVTASTAIGDSLFHHILLSWDTATLTKHVYLDDVDVTPAGGIASTNTLDYTHATWGIAASSTGTAKFNGAISELYFAPGQYLDFSVEANRRKFIDVKGNPVPLGADGSTPTGTAPKIYMQFSSLATCHVHSGTGGNFVKQGAPTITSGPYSGTQQHTAADIMQVLNSTRRRREPWR